VLNRKVGVMGKCGERKKFWLHTVATLRGKWARLALLCVLGACQVAMGQIEGMTYYPQQDGVNEDIGKFPLQKGLSYTAVFGRYLWVVRNAQTGAAVGYAWRGEAQVTKLDQFRERIRMLLADLKGRSPESATGASADADAAAKQALRGALQRVQVLLDEDRVGPAAFWFDVVKRGKHVQDSCNRTLGDYLEVLSEDQRRELSAIKERVAELAREVEGGDHLAIDVKVRDTIWYQQQAVDKITSAAASTLEELQAQRQLEKERRDARMRAGVAAGVIVTALIIAAVAAVRHRGRTAGGAEDK